MVDLHAQVVLVVEEVTTAVVVVLEQATVMEELEEVHLITDIHKLQMEIQFHYKLLRLVFTQLIVQQHLVKHKQNYNHLQQQHKVQEQA